MRISSQAVQMKSARSYAATSKTVSKTTTQSILMSAPARLPFSHTNLGAQNGLGLGANIFGNGQEGNTAWNSRFAPAQNIRGVTNNDNGKTLAQIQEETMDYLMMLFFGKPPKLTQTNLSSSGPMTGLMSQTVETTTFYQEEEHTSFSTTGTVVTADGRELSFSVEVSMSRSFAQATYSRRQMLTTMEFCDPLVINLNTDSAEVSDQKFFFDLDADGHEEAISTLKPGSAFLALDKNGDGKINDGSELFGAKSGDGFADLAKYDFDKNGWIDEADPIFDKLLIWTKDSSGKDVLCGLGKAGIGAIYLGNSSTDFSLTGKEEQRVNARIRKTGIFLYENGAAGTIQHVDFAR